VFDKIPKTTKGALHQLVSSYAANISLDLLFRTYHTKHSQFLYAYGSAAFS